jgi:hypothetical protein
MPDAQLSTTNQPYFKPFVGRDYLISTRFHGRVLILGESHYLKKPEDNRRDFLQTLVRSVAEQRAMIGWKTRYYRNLFYLLTGKRNSDVSDSDWEATWDSLAFYNFVQSSALTRPRMRPSKNDWADAVAPFLFVLSDLRPNLVIITGHILNGFVSGIRGIKTREKIRGMWIPTAVGDYAFARCVYHPSTMRFLSHREAERASVEEMLHGTWPTPD